MMCRRIFTRKRYCISTYNFKYMLQTNLNGVNLDILYDPGAAHSVIGESIWKKMDFQSFKKTNNLIKICAVKNKEHSSDMKTHIDLSRFKDIFRGNIGAIKGRDVRIHIASRTVPKCFRTRTTRSG